VFVFNPLTAWNWLRLPSSERLELETGVDAVVATRRWNQIAIHQRLKFNEMYDHADRVPFLESATGGWPVLLDRVFERASAKFDPRPEASTILDAVMRNENGARDIFLTQIGLDAVRVVRHVCDELCNYAPLRTKELRAEAFTSPSMPLTAAELEAAVEWLEVFGCLDRRGDVIDVERVLKKVLKG
jgi:hypothetical protein